jgi:tRNA threonylcarbamoyladenosine biosynthesis protein TsaB
MRMLVLNGASGVEGAGFALIEDGIVAEHWACGRGAAEQLAPLLRQALKDAGWTSGSLEVIAALVGPGSFTGLRATLALAHGVALGGGCAVIGVTVGEAMAASVLPDAPVWCVSRARRDRVFIERIAPDRSVAVPSACMVEALPDAGASLVLCGDAGEQVADLLRARGVAVSLGPARPDMRAIADVAMLRRSGRLKPVAAQPLYVDPPEAKLPASPVPALA